MLARYRASLAFHQDQGGEPEVACPTNTELNPSGERVDPSATPTAVQEAYGYYKKHVQDEDIGSVSIYAVAANGVDTYAVRVRTDGDDGCLEVYAKDGQLLGAGRTNMEFVAWGSRDWLRAQVNQPGTLPPELQDSFQRTVWGKPLPG
jgi:hypothetical protein